MTILDWMAQGIGLLGILTGIWAASRKSDKQLIHGFMVSNLLVATQMLLTGAYATAGSGIVSTIRLYFANKTRATWVMLFFMALFGPCLRWPMGFEYGQIREYTINTKRQAHLNGPTSLEIGYYRFIH